MPIATDIAQDVALRQHIYRRLAIRNRVVGLLRIAVPALGAVTLVGLIAQIYISNLGNRFSIGRISVTSDSVSVEAPEYVGVLDDGTAYHVTAEAAAAGITTTDQIGLVHARLLMTRPDGTTMTVEAEQAVLNTTTEVVNVDGTAQVANSLGTEGTIENATFDYAAEVLDGKGPVDITYSDGTHIVAEGIGFDVKSAFWTFTNATVTLPDTPGARTNP